MFPIKLVEKDLSYAMKTAQANDAKLPLVEAAQHIFASALDQEYADNNITGIAQLYL